MFWKKKTDDISLFTYESNTRRAFYRLRLSADEDVTFTLGENEHVVIDLGGGGLSFENTGFVEGDVGPITLRLHDHSNAIPAILKIRCICKNRICHCAFIEIADDDVEKIHQYLLQKQKDMARSRKSRIS
ncbi:MAG: PilZ domain-containing protein [Deltaproteobacteria bacterium]|nr:PilZ domain-containing protein [Deltaproteobacteria bacterium]